MELTREAIVAASPDPAIGGHIFDKWFAAPPTRLLAYAIRKYGLDRCSVADVGSAYGHALRRFGPGSYGVEMNPQAAEWSRAIGLTVYEGEFEQLDLPKVSAAWCRDVLEHVDSPHMLFRSLSKVLEDDGLAFLALPLTNYGRFLRRLSGAFRGYLAADHINFFTATTLRLTVERAGFEVIELTTGMGKLADLGLAFAPACLVVARKIPGWEYGPKSTRDIAKGRKDLELHGFVG